MLLEALAAMPDVFLWLAGDGPQKQTLMRIADNLKISDRIRFLGWRSDTSNLLAAVDALICPSRHEPLGNVILEAWVQGKPVVAAASDGPQELITSGKNGLLCEIDNPTNLADTIKELLGDANLAEELAIEGRKAYERNFSKKIIVKQYTDFFDKLVQ